MGGRLAAKVVSGEPRTTVYTEAMEVFHRAADLIGLDRRVRMELEEPDYEHIFYVTVKLHTRLAPLTEGADRSEEHTSELQSQSNLVCRLLLEKKKKTATIQNCFRTEILSLRSSASEDQSL